MMIIWGMKHVLNAKNASGICTENSMLTCSVLLLSVLPYCYYLYSELRRGPYVETCYLMRECAQLS